MEKSRQETPTLKIVSGKGGEHEKDKEKDGTKKSLRKKSGHGRSHSHKIPKRESNKPNDSAMPSTDREWLEFRSHAAADAPSRRPTKQGRLGLVLYPSFLL